MPANRLLDMRLPRCRTRRRGYASTPQASLTPPQSQVDNWPVDLGTTNDLRTVGATGAIRIELTTQSGVIELGFGGLPQTDELFLTHVIHPSGDRVAFANNAPPIGQSIAVSAAVPVAGSVQGIDDQIRLTKINERQWKEGKKDVSVILDGLIAKAATHISGTSRPLSTAVSDEVRSLFESMTYLRANRKRPSRGYRNDVGKIQAIGYSGEWAPSIIFKNQEAIIEYAEPPAIPSSSDADAAKGDSWKPRTESLKTGIDFWLSHLGLAKKAIYNGADNSDSALLLQMELDGQKQHDITEIGFGVSQVLPVLTAGLLSVSRELTGAGGSCPKRTCILGLSRYLRIFFDLWHFAISQHWSKRIQRCFSIGFVSGQRWIRT